MREPSGSQPDVRASRTWDARRSAWPRHTTANRPHPGAARVPKPWGRTVVPLTITVTHAQRAELEVRANTERTSISTMVRRFVAAGLAAGGLFGLFILAASIAIVRARPVPLRA